MTTLDADVGAPARPIGPVIVAFLTALWVAVPTAVGWTAGFVVRLAVLGYAAVIESYAVGRGAAGE